MTKEGNVLYLGMTTQEETAELLRLFLIQRKKLSISNLGSFEWVRIPATFNEATGSFSEPQEFFRFSGTAAGHSDGLMAFLSSKWTISEQEVDQKLTDWCSFVMECLESGETFEWTGIGTLVQKDNQICLQQLVGEKVGSDHTIPIQPVEDSADVTGENEELLPETTRHWNVWMVLLALVSVAMIILYAYKHERLGVGRSGTQYPAQPPLQYEIKSAS
jgi:nucleoid DNA-binding protein